MNAILKEFLIESNDSLSLINEEMTKFEKNPENLNLLNSIYRTIHTIKGSASFLGFTNLEKLTHSLENILDSVREAKVSLNSELVDIFLNGFDLCQLIIKNIEKDGHEGSTEVESLLKKLSKYGNALNSEYTIDSEIQSQLFDDEVVMGSLKFHGVKKVETKDEGHSKAIKTQRPAKGIETTVENITLSKADNSNVIPLDKKDSTVKSTINESVRVNVSLLDKILNMVGELVLNRNQILQFAKENDEPELNRLSHQLNVITTELQTDIMTTRMQPVNSVFGKFERTVRDLARSQSKKITLDIQGQETELDKTLLEVIKDPLIHLVRNAVDHGLEGTEERINAGKSETGRLSIKAYHEGGEVVIEISDDGRGIDTQRVLNKAIEKGLVDSESGSKLSDSQISQFIFHPGFSTAEKVTNISGRGVGMDVVRSNIEKIGGQIDIITRKGNGSTFKLKIPLTLAIVPALVAKSGNEIFAIAQKNLVELVLFEDEQVNNIETLYEQEFFRLRGELIPIFRLNSALKMAKEQENRNVLNLIVLQAEDNQFALVVDEILHTQEIVVKPLPRKLKCQNVYSGATIMGDGNVALIIDALGFFNMVDKGTGEKSKKEFKEDKAQAFNRSKDEKQEILLFELKDGRSYGVPLCLINRLEEIEVNRVEFSGKQAMVRYRNSAMPLIWLNDLIQFEIADGKLSNHVDTLFCLVVTFNNINYGFVVDEIKDIAYTSEDLDADSVDNKNFSGTIYIEEKLISLFDLSEVINKKYPNALKGRNEMQRALLVEDSLLFQNVEGSILDQMGFHVVKADNGKMALDILKNDTNFNLIVTDVEMPEIDGWQFAETVRKMSGEISSVPILAITTRVSDADFEKGQSCGFTEHIEKLNREVMINKVNFLTKGGE